MARLTQSRGLCTSANELTVPDGALVVADNTVIDYDNTVQQRRGYKEYSQLFTNPNKQLFTYKSKIITHYDQTLAFDSSIAGTFSNFSGSFSELIQGLRIKALEQNGNCYFTTSEGIKKISVKTDADISVSTPIRQAGAVKAADLSGKLLPDPAGFLPAQSKVAYRLVFGYKDPAGNLLLGSPSSRLVLTNQSQDVNSSEIFTVNVIDYTGIAASQYFLFSTVDTDYYVWFNLTGTDTPPVNADTLDREGVEILIQGLTTDASVAAQIANTLQSSVTGITVVLSGDEVEVTVVNPGDADNASQGNLSTANVLVTPIFDGSIVTGTPTKTELTFSLPDEIDLEYFYQIYRTGVVTVTAGVTLNDIDPGDEENFIFENPITAADILAGVITIQDNTPEAFRQVGAYLYTNAITGGGRGIVDANERPPIAQDIAPFRNSTFYANTKDLHRTTFSILSVDDFLSGSTKFFISQAASSVSYTFVGTPEVADITVQTQDDSIGNSYTLLNSANDERQYYVWIDKGLITNTFNSTTNVAANVITITGHGYATNDKVVLSGTVPVGLTVGTPYYVITLSANTISLSATVGGSAIALTPVVGSANITHTPADPTLTGKIGVRVPLELYDGTLQGSKDALIDSLLATADFAPVDFSSSVVRVTNADNGSVTAPSSSTPSSWTVAVVSVGEGEDTAAKEVLLSQSSSVGVAIDTTARSLVRVINSDDDSPVSATYLSGPDDLPGRILLEAKSLTDSTFYIAISDPALVAEFSPELPVKVTLTDINNTTNVFTTAASHGLLVGDQIYLNDNPTGTPVEFSGTYTIATTPTGTTFTLVGIDVGLNQVAISGTIYRTTVASDNNLGPNRVYFSKTNQPEAVPSVNYIDVGSKDKAILRILALRDNLFALKEDGIYIITGAAAPNFSVRLLDNSAILTAPDSAVVLNNLIYCLTTQGVVSISDSGVSIVSRQIEDQIKKVTTFSYNFTYTSFGVSYESDRAYIIWLPTLKSDTVATQAFRYSTITNTWTRWTKSNTCGLVRLVDDRMYLGKGGRNYVEQERKNGERQDYADRDFARSIGVDAVSNLALLTNPTIKVSSVVDVEIGDVMTQDQYLDVPKFNRFLKKLDRDSGPAYNNYYELYQAMAGDNLATTLQDFVDYLNTDPNLSGTFTVPSGSTLPTAIRDGFNLLMDELNGLSSGTNFKTYRKATDLLTYEVLITGVSIPSNTLTVDRSTWFIQGNVTIYKAIKSEVQWAPQHFGAPEKMKQITEGTLMFDQGTIYGGILSYSSDRSADFKDIVFQMDGPGFWACFDWIDIPWGGNSNGVDVRTLIPQDKSRCRYLNVKFKHFNAREQYKLIGMSLESREVSTRAYR